MPAPSVIAAGGPQQKAETFSATLLLRPDVVLWNKDDISAKDLIGKENSWLCIPSRVLTSHRYT